MLLVRLLHDSLLFGAIAVFSFCLISYSSLPLMPPFGSSLLIQTQLTWACRQENRGSLSARPAISHSFKPWVTVWRKQKAFFTAWFGRRSFTKKEICPTAVEAAWLTGAECGYLDVRSWLCESGRLENKADELLNAHTTWRKRELVFPWCFPQCCAWNKESGVKGNRVSEWVNPPRLQHSHLTLH